MNDEEKKSPFVVRDRRRFDASGNRRGDEEETAAEKPAQAAPPPPPRPRSPSVEVMDKEEDDVGPETDAGGDGAVGFAELLLSIATNAVLHLGGDTKDGRIPGRVNLPLAAQHIDIIAMLAQKTRGNLDREEQDLLESLLYDLRMKYVAVAQAEGRGRGA